MKLSTASRSESNLSKTYQAKNNHLNTNNSNPTIHHDTTPNKKGCAIFNKIPNLIIVNLKKKNKRMFPTQSIQIFCSKLGFILELCVHTREHFLDHHSLSIVDAYVVFL